MNKVCAYVTDRVVYDSKRQDFYVSTDNLLQNCEGVISYDGVPNISSVVRFKSGDILLSNIRPYLKKLWLADRDGVCNADVLVIRVINDGYMPDFVYGLLRRQQFFDYVMTNVKGLKMPRGDKQHILKYPIPMVKLEIQKQIVAEIRADEAKITEAKAVINGCAWRKQTILDKYLR